jgi:predicted transcriptional regulator of viral defense system
LSVLEELAEELEESDVVELLSWYQYKSTLQRLGYLLQKVQAPENSIARVSTHLESGEFSPVLLIPGSPQKLATVNNKWKVNINIELKSDL